jgi:EAL domain-containing protein (putative c-di-GMP-specific phosphodiesterase class I)
VTVSCSVGIAVTADHPSAADLIHQADMAMYEAKTLGPGRVVIHGGAVTSPDPHSRRSTERRLFQALHHGEFQVHYQPIVEPDGRIAAVEALLRWQHPERGLLPAADFIQAAEATGAIVAIGRWVLTQALHDLHHWQQTTPRTAPELVFCNLSPRELTAQDLPEVIDTTLRRHHLTPSHLGIEIVEADLADTRLTQAVQQLNDTGHAIAVDDFGTGYSSLSRLIDLPAAYLKIDRSLVTGLPGDHRSRTLIDAVLTIARRLQITVISEGIETPEQAAYLTTAGSHLLQGHLFAPALPAPQIQELLTRNH